MSLVGLDTPAVLDAHHAAHTEATGWFLVKYISRDTVELLKRGLGGVAEVRAAVEQYEEKSPLYGLVHHRRKKIILKYVPEGTSRLLQVRLTVQFQSVLEAFTPHDAVFPFTAPEELSESALALNTMLSPASNSSTTSGSSLRRRRLNEISEDVEMGNAIPRKPVAAPDVSEGTPSSDNGRKDLDQLPASAVLAKALLAKRKEAEGNNAPATSSPLQTSYTPSTDILRVRPSKESLKSTQVPLLNLSPSPSPAPVIEKALPATPDPTPPPTSQGFHKEPVDPVSTVPLTTINSSTSTENKERKHTADQEHNRHLSADVSDSISQWSNNVAAYAPSMPKKKKLGPRPHVETINPPRTSSTSGKSEATVRARPVANLPASIRVSGRPNPLNNTAIPPRPGSAHSSKSVPGRFQQLNHHAQILPPLPSPTRVAQSYYRAESRQAPSRAASVTTEASTATPEKLRLMKALQMRKRNMLLSQRTSASTQASASSHTHSASLASTNTSRGHFSSVSTIKSDAHEPLANIDESLSMPNPSAATSPTTVTNISEEPSTTASSFTSGDTKANKRHSHSSDTSSSVTPKPGPEVEKLSKPTRAIGIPVGTKTIRTFTRVDAPQRAVTPKHDPVPTTVEDEDDDAAQEPQASPLEEAYMRLTGGIDEQTTSGAEKPEPTVEAGKTEPVLEKSSLDKPSADPTSEKQKEPEPTAADKATEPEPTNESEPQPKQDVLPVSSPHTGHDEPKRLKPHSGARRAVSSAEASEMSDDDSFMDELRNATVHEAKPISVARTPVTPVMANVGASHSRDLSRAASNSKSQNPQNQATSEAGRSPPPRKSSLALPQWPPAPELQPVPLTKKATLGSGISKRIKALEVLSTREATSPPRQTSGDNTAPRSTFGNFMKRSSLLMQQPPNVSSDGSPKKRGNESGTFSDHEIQQENTNAWVQRHGSTTQIFPPSQKGETVAVAARVIRDNQSAKSPRLNEPIDGNLHRSPVLTEREKTDGNRQYVNRETSTENSSRSPQLERGDRHRFSFSSHTSNSQPRLPYAESVSKTSLVSPQRRQMGRYGNENASFQEEKIKGSRAARLMKRVSNLTHGGRKGTKNTMTSRGTDSGRNFGHPDTIAEQNERGNRASVADSLLHVVDIGEVNVQFPDSNLWKRRFMRIDDQGYLIFSPPANDVSMRGISRKYQLSDFRMPTLPDAEREEMAWSILLDLRDGSSVQCACESKQAQQQVLQMLVDAHSAYQQLYGR